jgi:hypothetical protein
VIVYRLHAVKKRKYFTWLHAIEDRGFAKLENQFVTWVLAGGGHSRLFRGMSPEDRVVSPYCEHRLPPAVRYQDPEKYSSRKSIVLPVVMFGRPFLFAEVRESTATRGFPDARYDASRWAQYLTLRSLETP